MYNLRRKVEEKAVILDENSKKLELTYPCSWCYKLIATSKDDILQATTDILNQRTHTLSYSNKSKGGKYVSMNLDMLVHNEEDRTFIYEALKKHNSIKMVL